MDSINILLTLDDKYIPQLKVFLTSLRINNPGECFFLFLIHSGIKEEYLSEVNVWCSKHGWRFFSLLIDDGLFAEAPSSKQYPKEMYYRLLAPYILPEDVMRIIYIDPDTLVINPLRPLWEMDMKGKPIAAASHTGITEIANGVNRIRLGTESDYYNSGVLLIDTERARIEIIPEDIFAYVKEHQNLILPDQDVLNALYGKRILPLDDAIWNYDARNYSSYLLRSGGVQNEAWVMHNTAILHFCGKAKPWKKSYIYRFGLLYLHYEEIAYREWGN